MTKTVKIIYKTIFVRTNNFWTEIYYFINVETHRKHRGRKTEYVNSYMVNRIELLILICKTMLAWRHWNKVTHFIHISLPTSCHIAYIHSTYRFGAPYSQNHFLSFSISLFLHHSCYPFICSCLMFAEPHNAIY